MSQLCNNQRTVAVSGLVAGLVAAPNAKLGEEARRVQTSREGAAAAAEEEKEEEEGGYCAATRKT